MLPAVFGRSSPAQTPPDLTLDVALYLGILLLAGIQLIWRV